MPPQATVIVRAKDKESTIKCSLASVREQTVPVELIVIDSGSRDKTIAIADHWADRVLHVPTERFTYGFALNLGAREARAPVHVALSAHSTLPARDWIERALSLLALRDVAAACGRSKEVPGVDAAGGVFFQDADHAREHPWWGMSNHASAWRADVWTRFAFDEGIEFAEDKEWALRVLSAGWSIAFDPHLYVRRDHVWQQGLREFHGRELRGARALTSFAKLPRYGMRQLAEDWWHGCVDHRPAWRRRLSPMRAAGLVGKFRGMSATRR